MAKAARMTHGPRDCKQCRTAFIPRVTSQAFCKKKCRVAFNNKRQYTPAEKRSGLFASDAASVELVERIAELKRLAKIIRDRSAKGPLSSQDLAPLLTNLLDTIEGK